MKQLEGRRKEHRGREYGTGGGRGGEEEGEQRRGEEKEWRPVSRVARFSTNKNTQSKTNRKPSGNSKQEA
jgi:hypothetical protein